MELGFKQIGIHNGLPLFGKEDQKPEDRQQVLHLSREADLLAQAGNTARNNGKYEVSVILFERALALCPRNAYLLSGLGAALWFCGRFKSAERMLRQSISLNPADPMAYSNLGTVMASVGEPKKSTYYFEEAIKRDPGNNSIKWNYAMALLDHGEWEKAWQLYEVRAEYLNQSGNKFPKFPYPKWDGESLDNKTLYVHFEQGWGDRLLFSRYLYWVHQRWPTCKIIALPTAPPMPDMRDLLWEFSSFVHFLPAGIPWPKADYGVYLMSLPRIHGTTPSKVPMDPGLIRKRIERESPLELPKPHVAGIKVGVCWSGNPLMMRNSERSVPLEMMIELGELPNVNLYGLQFAPGNADIDRVGARDLICDLSDDINAHGGFVGTGAVMLSLDLIITVCTANVHLAGALGVPCWTLLCNDPYWLWLRGRDDSVWYPNMRLFRQPKVGDWRSVIDRVKTELRHFAAKEMKQCA